MSVLTLYRERPSFFNLYKPSNCTQVLTAFIRKIPNSQVEVDGERITKLTSAFQEVLSMPNVLDVITGYLRNDSGEIVFLCHNSQENVAKCFNEHFLFLFFTAN